MVGKEEGWGEVVIVVERLLPSLGAGSTCLGILFAPPYFVSRVGSAYKPPLDSDAMGALRRAHSVGLA